MATFNNLNDLKKWIDSKQGQGTVLNENKIRDILTDAGRELEKLLKDELNVYFSSYTPSVYTRTGDTLNSIIVGKPKKISINEWSLEITFDPSLANHPSVFGQEDGYTPWLLHSGWKTKLDSTLDIENFTRFKGTNYITKAVDKFNVSNRHGLKVSVFRGNEDVTGKNYSYGS